MGTEIDDDGGPRAELQKTKQRLEAEADRAVAEFDEGIVDLLAWLLDTETRARIYVYLRQHPHSTSDEIAEGTGLYPSTVREALADLHEDDAVERAKRDSDGAGNNPYEYEAIAPSSLVRGVVGEVQHELNTVFTLESDTSEAETDDGPVTITIDGPDGEGDDATDSDEADDDDAVDVDTDSSDGDSDPDERADV
ncbi:ArsR family transcriptional regulator [Halonotius roseus]|uniref:ArsR family transcriptional regulator n=2 Tax=Halonotius roseus TaxID=2511997 RepID=A0A544QM98_9EURY|nr:winged helix-turn-helix domain-containing protein [Halonotius roseus]TQQ79731.1 ArsR family transcriptional regulator [Halonotius roseus]